MPSKSAVEKLGNHSYKHEEIFNKNQRILYHSYEKAYPRFTVNQFKERSSKLCINTT
jgi:hypothetical protein